MTKPEVPNAKISLEFAGLKTKNNILPVVSVDNNTGCPDAIFLPDTTAHRVVEFLNEYISKNRIRVEFE